MARKKNFFKLLDTKDIVERFYEHHKDFFLRNNLTKNHVYLIVTSPFSFLKYNLKNNRIYVQRHKYFGTFHTSVKRAKYALKDVEKKYNKGSISERKYLEVKEMINEFLSRKDV